jgi:acetyl esterase
MNLLSKIHPAIVLLLVCVGSVSAGFFVPESKRKLNDGAIGFFAPEAQERLTDGAIGFFVPEAQERLAGGATTGTGRKISSSSERATDKFDLSPFQGFGESLLLSRWFRHRLISGVPSGLKTDSLFASLLFQPNCQLIIVRNPEGNYIIPGVKGDIVYRRVGGVELSLDAYIQKRGSKRPAVIVIHGGNWESGSRVSFVGQFLELLTAAGYNWFAIDYRKGGASRVAESVDDLRVAIEFVRCHAKEFRIDPNNIALLGEDTGANLALTTAENIPGIKAVVSIGGVFPDSQLPTFNSQLPIRPTLVIHGGNDAPQQAEQFCRAMRACEFVSVESAIHRAENWWPSQWSYKRKLTEWLAKQMKLSKADHQPYTTNLRKDIVFSPRHGLKLDTYAPKSSRPLPAVIIAHGGGWEAGDKVTYATPLFEPLAKAGFAWFSIDYRLTPQVRNADQLEDLREAIRFVRANAKRFNVDPNRIAILGESASGQLVAQLATEKFEGVAAVVSFYGVYDFLPMATSFAPRSIPARLFGVTELNAQTREVMKSFSPLYQVKAGMPPLLLIQGTADRLHAQAVAFEKELNRVGAQFDVIDVAGAPHGVENWEGHAEWLSYKTKLVEWLRARLK